MAISYQAGPGSYNMTTSVAPIASGAGGQTPDYSGFFRALALRQEEERARQARAADMQLRMQQQQLNEARRTPRPMPQAARRAQQRGEQFERLELMSHPLLQAERDVTLMGAGQSVVGGPGIAPGIVDDPAKLRRISGGRLGVQSASFASPEAAGLGPSAGGAGEDWGNTDPFEMDQYGAVRKARLEEAKVRAEEAEARRRQLGGLAVAPATVGG